MDLFLPYEDEIYEKTFDHLDASQETVWQKEFDQCTFKNCNFYETVFINCIFTDCKFENSDLSMVDWQGSRLRSSAFKTCKLVGIKWDSAGWLKFINFKECVLNYGAFMQLDLTDIEMTGCQIYEALFAECNLSDAKFNRSDLTGTRFNYCDLSGADFRQAKNYVIDIKTNQIEKGHFQMPDAIGLLMGLGIHLDED
jgi:uncharacterized protein YjbI with pentapeptide repeats